MGDLLSYLSFVLLVIFTWHLFATTPDDDE